MAWLQGHALGKRRARGPPPAHSTVTPWPGGTTASSLTLGDGEALSMPVSKQATSSVVELAWATGKRKGHPALTWKQAGECAHTRHSIPPIPAPGGPSLCPLQAMGLSTLYQFSMSRWPGLGLIFPFISQFNFLRVCYEPGRQITATIQCNFTTYSEEMWESPNADSIITLPEFGQNTCILIHEHKNFS